MGETPAPPVTSSKASVVDSTATDEYNKAFALFEQEKNAEAIALFEKFVKKYPDHPYADNAVYWIGEAYFRIGDFDNGQFRESDPGISDRK
jgi:TolA-binding protein